MRERHPMPDDVAQALDASGLREAYDARPDYQRNDYVGWITRASRPQTRAARTAQMLEELARGGVYMRMEHAPSRKDEAD